VAVWSSSTTQARCTQRGPYAPASRAASRSRIGRRRLPPAPAMYSPISWTRATGESSSWRMASSTERRSSPTSAATRSLRTCSRAGVGTLLRDDPVSDLDLGSRADPLDLREGKPIAQLHDLGRRHFLVELAQLLARHGMHDGRLVAPDAHHRARAEAVGRREI